MTEKTASQMIIDLQEKNAKLRLGLGKLLKICENTNMYNKSEVWAQQIGFAKQMFTETDPNNALRLAKRSSQDLEQSRVNAYKYLVK